MSDTFAAEAPATIGDNRSPELLITGDELSTYLSAAYQENIMRAEALLKVAPKYLVINNDAEDAAATEYLVKVRACWKTAEAARTAEKTPYDDAAGRVHAFFRSGILDPLGLAPTDKRIFDPLARPDLGIGPRVTMAQTIYKTAKMEIERKAREAEERRAREAEEKARQDAIAAENAARELELAAARKRNAASIAAAQAVADEARRKADEAREAENKAAEERAAAQAAASASAADLTRSRGERGGVSSLREFVDFRDIDRDTLDYQAIGPYLTDKAVETAIRSYLDANKATVNTGIKSNKQPLKGVTFYIAHKASGRA